MPALFSLGLHDAIHHASQQLRQGEQIVAYLDDIYLLTGRDRARTVYDLTTEAIRTHAGIQPNLGKTESWCSGGGPSPPGIQELTVPGNDSVWKRRFGTSAMRIRSIWISHWIFGVCSGLCP